MEVKQDQIDRMSRNLRQCLLGRADAGDFVLLVQELLKDAGDQLVVFDQQNARARAHRAARARREPSSAHRSAIRSVSAMAACTSSLAPDPISAFASCPVPTWKIRNRAALPFSSSLCTTNRRP